MRGAKRLNLGPANGRSAESVLRSAKLPRQPRRQSATGGDANDRSVKSFLAPLRLNLMTRCCGRRAPAEQRDRKSVGEGKSVSGRVEPGAPRTIKKKHQAHLSL